MYLKALEIIGFKSFADKVRLNFEPGVSCIVGPNGCGKSNVIDSVRWAIGEMSWKSLRSGSMVDIIFNGTKQRPPQNMAQVNMIFDNSKRELPIDFSEVTVSRKIYRSGESEYYLNRVQCRLKDIREMFLDTGIGGEGYAIIDQGSISRLLENAGPLERREMFEEVAGVSKYKAKRDEAIRRLEHVDMDIARLSDTLTLIAEQIKKLDSEARKARLYQKYREELKESEIALALENIKSHDAEINKTSFALEPILKELQDLQATVSALEGEAAALDLNLTHRQKEYQEFNEKIAAAKYQIGLLEGVVQNCQNLTGELTLQLQSSKAEEELSKKRLLELAPALQNLQKQLTQAAEALVPLQEKYNQKYAQVKQNEEQLKIVQEQMENASSKLLTLAQEEMELSGKIALEESAISHENNNLINLQRNLEIQNERAKNIDDEISNFQNTVTQKEQELNTLKQNQQELEKAKNNLENQRQELNKVLSNLQADIASLKTKMQMIEMQGKKDPYWLGAKIIEENKIAGIMGTLRKNIKFKKEYTLTVEETLGKFLDSLICQDLATAQKAIEILKKKGGARGRFLILNKVPTKQADNSLYNNAQNLRSLIECKPELSALLDYLCAGYALDGSEVAGSFWLSGGEKEVKTLESFWAEEENAKTDLKQKTKEQEETAQKIIKNMEEISLKEQEIKTAVAKIQEDLIALNTAKNNLALRQKNKQEIEETKAQINKNKEALLKNLETRKQKINTSKEELKIFRTKQEETKKEAETLRQKRAGLETEAANLKVEIEKANAALYEVKLKKNNIELDLKTSSGEQQNLAEQEKKRQEQMLKSQERVKALEEEKLTSQAKLTAQRDSLAALELSEAKMKEGLTALKLEFDNKNTALNKHKTHINELTVKSHDLENTLTNHRRQKTAIINTLLESWNITQEEAQMKWGEKKVDLERVKMMRHRIESMGNVNMTAPEEYDALKERNDFLTKQIEDLQNAKRDLKSAITKINATTRENFKYTFEQVRTYYKEIYKKLSLGGEAELTLTDPNNLLETGIEVTAQPPGKKLLSIAVLSGGEKAFAALALLFAFFMHKPSPFCILDEADAPLDEANVGRYVDVIKEFSANTQFIVVTHNKTTMSAAQMLYGITLEEKGVSKVLSLNLKEQEEKINQLVA